MKSPSSKHGIFPKGCIITHGILDGSITIDSCHSQSSVQYLYHFSYNSIFNIQIPYRISVWFSFDLKFTDRFSYVRKYRFKILKWLMRCGSRTCFAKNSGFWWSPLRRSTNTSSTSFLTSTYNFLRVH